MRDFARRMKNPRPSVFDPTPPVITPEELAEAEREVDEEEKRNGD
jgi:hypothetical protein